MKILNTQQQLAATENRMKIISSTVDAIEKEVTTQSKPNPEIEKHLVKLKDELKPLREEFVTLKKMALRQNKAMTDAVKQILDQHGSKAYDFARVMYSHSNLIAFCGDDASALADYLNEYFTMRGIEKTEWSDMDFTKEEA